MSPDQIAVFIPIIAVSIPIVAIWTKHQQKMAEIKAQQGAHVAPDVNAALNSLREEIAALRDTTTRFDMSFDAAITRLEERMERVEEEGTAQITAPAPPRAASIVSDDEPQTLVLSAGRGA